MTTKDLEVLKIYKLTQAQYDRRLASGALEEDALYLTPDIYSSVSEPVSFSMTKNNNTVEVVTVLENGDSYNDTIYLNDQGYPYQIKFNNQKICNITWTGF